MTLNILNKKNTEKYIGFAFILLMCGSFSSMIFYRYALEHIRYIFIILIAATYFINKEILNDLSKNREARVLLIFFIISLIGLILNDNSIKNIDEIANWILIFGSGYITSFYLKKYRPKILIFIPLALFTVYIIVPLLIGDGFRYIDPSSHIRLHVFFAQRANHLGLISGISTLIAFHYLLKKSSPADKIFFSILAIASLLIHISTGSRAVLLAMLMVCGLLVLWRFRNSAKTILLIVGTVALLTLLITQSGILGANRLARLGFNIQQDKSFQQRMLTWTIAKDTFLEKPWLGEGFDTFEKQFKSGRKHYAALPDFAERFPYTSGNTNNAHNFSLHFLAETGLLGLSAITFFWFSLIYRGFRCRTDTGVIVSGTLLLSYLSFQLNMGLYGSQLSTLIFSLAGLSAYEIDEQSRQSDKG